MIISPHSPFLHISEIYKTYENAPLLRGVTFDVERGEIACLLGPSGSGKTTLLRIIAGLEAPERGNVAIAGVDITGLPVHRRGVVLMFQDYALFPHRTVAENIAFGLRMRRQARAAIAERVAEMLTLTGLEDFADRDVNVLSGGERQRVALARSLAPQPRLLLLDEPLGALDRNLRERLLEELPAILRRVGVTAITVTHDQEEAFALSDRVVLLNAGRVVQTGRPETLYDRPHSVWVARFLGLENLFPARVRHPQQAEVAFGVLNMADNATVPQPGAEGQLLIHPWGIHLETGSPNPFTAQVTRRTFHGSYFRLTLAVDGGALHLNVAPGQTPPAPGATVHGWIEPAALRWLAD
jgi:ABC-type Fe3+/spermidine/putrescine transport system ATPase subunit